MIFLGIDIGTSAVKAVLVDEDETVVAEASSAPLVSAHPRPGWSEQDPQDWWRAVGSVVATLRAEAPQAFSGVAAIGLSGQMHGTVILDGQDRVIRPAILWNDGRATAECAALEAAVPELGRIAGIIAMPGFAAPKLAWLRSHEPEAFARIRSFMLPKDFVRLRLTGETATDMADAAGALLLDEARRDWSDALLDATGLTRAWMPRLLEGSAVSGRVRPAILAEWGLDRDVVVAAGGGDAAAGAVGIGAVEDGDAFISLGTSAQLLLTRDRYEPKPESLIHAFAHCLPGRWFEMAAMLNGATCLEWIARAIGAEDIGALLDRVEARFRGPSRLLFLPYLSGERTPHNDADIRAAFVGLDADSGAEEMVQAVLEGVAFSFVEAQAILGPALPAGKPVAATGGGARSRFWMRIMASALGRPVLRYRGAATGPAFGAARLARMALTGEPASQVCRKPEILETIEPDMALHGDYAPRFARYQALYRALRGRVPLPRAGRRRDATR